MSLHEFSAINKCITLRFQCIIFDAVLLCGCIKVYSSNIPPTLRDLNVLQVRVGEACRKACTKCCCSQTGYFVYWRCNTVGCHRMLCSFSKFYRIWSPKFQE